MISVFQIEVAPEDEAVLDDLFGSKLAETVDRHQDRRGVLDTVHVLKANVQGSSNTYIVIAGTNGLGFSFARAFNYAGFPASMKVTELDPSDWRQIAKWPDNAPDIDPDR